MLETSATTMSTSSTRIRIITITMFQTSSTPELTPKQNQMARAKARWGKIGLAYMATVKAALAEGWVRDDGLTNKVFTGQNYFQRSRQPSEATTIPVRNDGQASLKIQKHLNHFVLRFKSFSTCYFTNHKDFLRDVSKVVLRGFDNKKDTAHYSPHIFDWYWSSNDSRYPNTTDYVCSLRFIALNPMEAMHARDRLAISSAEMLLISTCPVIMFDRSGAVVGEPFNFHEEPDLFVGWFDIGFDRSIHLNDRNEAILRTQECRGRQSAKKVCFMVENVVFSPSNVVGRGTICFLATQENEKETKYVIKDSWVVPQTLEGKESEVSLLQHIMAKSISKGIAQYHHFAQVSHSNNPKKPDSILLNRRADQNSQDLNVERLHFRIFMKTFEKPISDFSSESSCCLHFTMQS
ncbi:hypothetical protein M422DRAFT_776128 [Sphaerobolus stellatus SS14]|nr:hypothetical protein M422DRAFT_776128 [Sphaerobolus stellatus SS14]